MSAGPKPGAWHARATCGHGPNTMRTPALPLRTPALPPHKHMHSSTTTPGLGNAWSHSDSVVSEVSLDAEDPSVKNVLLCACLQQQQNMRVLIIYWIVDTTMGYNVCLSVMPKFPFSIIIH